MRTNDGAVDPFLLTLANLYDAHNNGARILTHTAVKVITDRSVELADGSVLKADVIVNATGHACGSLLSGRQQPAVQPNKGTILVTERRLCDVVVNRMRMPGNGDIVVPGHTTSLIGTTSLNSTGTIPTREEYRELMREAIALMPSLKGVRIIRAFSGVRPLIGSGDGRELSRDYRIFEGSGVITVAGGKLTTYRLIAERAADAVMRSLGARGECHTITALPDILDHRPESSLLCNCESAKRHIIPMGFLKPEDLWKYERIGFGACQGMRCARNTLGEEAFLQERWKGEKPVLDESQLRQAYVSWASYKSKGGAA
jgi:glycerol-3-phosphate dehydrogenase